LLAVTGIPNGSGGAVGIAAALVVVNVVDVEQKLGYVQVLEQRAYEKAATSFQPLWREK
jgi:hypothetical protein